MQLPDLDYQLVVTALFGGLAGAILTQVSNLLLSAWRQPKLEILFSRAEVGCVTETPVLASGKRGEQRYLRLRVRNVGRSAVHGVNVCVTSIQYFPASGAPVIFTREVLDLQRALSGEIKFDLGRGGYRFVDLFSVTQWPLDNNPAQQHGFAFERTGSARVRKAPAVAAKMLGMVAGAPDKLAGLRDRALLLLGFAGAFRRSELVALDVADIAETEAGLIVTIRHSKTDQEGKGVTIAIARGDVACPVKALREWLGAGRAAIPPDQQGGQGGSGAADGSFRCQYCQGVCGAGRIRRQHFFRALPAIWVSHVCSGQGRIDFQDDGRVPAQVGGDLAWLCARRRVVQGSRRDGAALDRTVPMKRICPNPIPWNRAFERPSRHAKSYVCTPSSPPLQNRAIRSCEPAQVEAHKRFGRSARSHL
jgi:hypothetical protein